MRMFIPDFYYDDPIRMRENNAGFKAFLEEYEKIITERIGMSIEEMLSIPVTGAVGYYTSDGLVKEETVEWFNE